MSLALLRTTPRALNIGISFSLAFSSHQRAFPTEDGNGMRPTWDGPKMAQKGAFLNAQSGYGTSHPPLPDRRAALIRLRRTQAANDFNNIRLAARTDVESTFMTRADLEGGKTLGDSPTSLRVSDSPRFAKLMALRPFHEFVPTRGEPDTLSLPTAHEMKLAHLDGPTGDVPHMVIYRRRYYWGSSRRVLKDFFIVTIDSPTLMQGITGDTTETRTGGAKTVDRTFFQGARSPRFGSIDDAIAYCQRIAMPYRVVDDLKPDMAERPRTYAQNFDFKPEDKGDRFAYSDDI